MSFSLNSRIVDLVAPNARRQPDDGCDGSTISVRTDRRPASTERRALLLAMASAPLFALPGSAAASTNPVAGLKRWGSGQFRRFGLLIYEATLWAGRDPMQPPLALRLDYNWAIEGKAIAEASVKEMRRFVTDEARLKSWGDEMRRVFPDVRPGEHILGVHLSNEARFYQNERLIGVIASPGFAAAFFAIWLDALVDPWLGRLADGVSRQRMLAVALVPFALGFVALLNPPPGASAPWLLASLVLTYLGFSAASVAYQAWGAAVGDGSAARTRLTAAREGFGLLGVVLAAALPGLLADHLATGVERLSWLLPPLMLIAALVTFSHVGALAPTVAPPAVPVGQSQGSLLRPLHDAAFRRLLWVFIANGIAAALPATLFLFFVADVLGSASMSGPLLALYFVAGAASLPAWVRLAGRFGRVPAWGLAMLLAMLSFAGAGLLGRGDVAPFALICLASGLSLGADLALPAAIAADLGERQGQTGTCFGLWNLVAKLNLALAAGLALPMLDVLGYRLGGEGGGDALVGGLGALTFAYAFLPLAFKSLAAGLLWRWRHVLEIRS